MTPELFLLANTNDTLSIAEALVGLPVAVSIVFISLFLWRLLASGKLVLGREHDELREDRDWWRKVATRALNIGEAVTSRREGT